MKKTQTSRKTAKNPNKTYINNITSIKIKVSYLKLSQDLPQHYKYLRISSLEELLIIKHSSATIKLRGRQKNHKKEQIFELRTIRS
jgi:hypothetical protein